jgi:hypothetical protein
LIGIPVSGSARPMTNMFRNNLSLHPLSRSQVGTHKVPLLLVTKERKKIK